MGEVNGGMVSEYSIETCILPYVKWVTSENSMHEVGHSKPVLSDSPQGLGEEGDERGVRIGGHMCTCG